MEIRDFFKHYRNAFNALNVNQITSHFTLPFTTLHQGQITVWDRSTAQELYSSINRLVEHYRANGFVKADITVGGTLPMGKDTVSVVVYWTIQRHNAAPWEYATGYHLKQENGQWQIYGLVLFDDNIPGLEPASG